MLFKQPGSSIKPVLSYGLAFEYLGYTLDEILIDKPTTFPGESRIISNASGYYQGDVTIEDAVAYSLNTPAIQTLERVEDTIGQDAIVDYLQSMGFSHVNHETYDGQFAIGASAFEISPAELAGTLDADTVKWYVMHPLIAMILAGYKGERGYHSKTFTLVFKYYYAAHMLIVGLLGFLR